MMLPTWVKRYWKVYGGTRSLLRSPYIYLAAFLSGALYPLWVPYAAEPAWIDVSISLLPGLMGFSIGGMAILLAFSHPQSLRAITQKGKTDSFFMKLGAYLCHFLIVQVIALLVALFAKAGLGGLPLAGFGVFSLIYAILLAAATVGQFFNTLHIMNTAAWLRDKDES